MSPSSLLSMAAASSHYHSGRFHHAANIFSSIANGEHHNLDPTVIQSVSTSLTRATASGTRKNKRRRVISTTNTSSASSCPAPSRHGDDDDFQNAPTTHNVTLKDGSNQVIENDDDKNSLLLSALPSLAIKADEALCRARSAISKSRTRTINHHHHHHHRRQQQQEQEQEGVSSNENNEDKEKEKDADVKRLLTKALNANASYRHALKTISFNLYRNDESARTSIISTGPNSSSSSLSLSKQYHDNTIHTQHHNNDSTAEISTPLPVQVASSMVMASTTQAWLYLQLGQASRACHEAIHDGIQLASLCFIRRLRGSKTGIDDNMFPVAGTTTEEALSVLQRCMVHDERGTHALRCVKNTLRVVAHLALGQPATTHFSGGTSSTNDDVDGNDDCVCSNPDERNKNRFENRYKDNNEEKKRNSSFLSQGPTVEKKRPPGNRRKTAEKNESNNGGGNLIPAKEKDSLASSSGTTHVNGEKDDGVECDTKTQSLELLTTALILHKKTRTSRGEEVGRGDSFPSSALSSSRTTKSCHFCDEKKNGRDAILQKAVSINDSSSFTHLAKSVDTVLRGLSILSCTQLPTFNLSSSSSSSSPLAIRIGTTIQKLEKLSVTSRTARNVLGCIYAKLGQMEKAADAFQGALEYDEMHGRGVECFEHRGKR